MPELAALSSSGKSSKDQTGNFEEPASRFTTGQQHLPRAHISPISYFRGSRFWGLQKVLILLRVDHGWPVCIQKLLLQGLALDIFSDQKWVQNPSWVLEGSPYLVTGEKNPGFLGFVLLHSGNGRTKCAQHVRDVFSFNHENQPSSMTGWWFGTWILIFHSVGNVIIPTDELIFFRGVLVYHQPDRYFLTINHKIINHQPLTIDNH